MSNRREELDQIRRILTRFSRPNHTIRSVAAAAMLEGLGNDKVPRLISRAVDLAGGEVTQFLDNHIVLTPLGDKFRLWLEDLHSIQKSQAERTEELRIAVHPGVDSGMLVPAIAAFTPKFSFVALRIDILSDGMQEAVDSGLFAFGVTLEVSEREGDGDRIEPPVPASVRISHGHRLAKVGGVIDAEHFTPADRVLLAPGIVGRVSELLRRVPSVNRIEVGPEMLRALVAVGGLGIEFAHPSRVSGESFTRLPALGVEPVCLGLVLPRRRTQNGEPAKFLIEAIRTAVREAAEQAIPLPELPDLEFPLPEPLSA